MSKFKKAYNITSIHEGGYANVTGDYGGETYKGISRRYHPGWDGWIIIDSVKASRDLKRNEFIKDKYLDKLVEGFYELKFWRKYGCHLIADQKIANFVYDYSVLAGVRGSTTLQKALNDLGQNVVVDGQIGPQTATAIIRVNRDLLLNTMIQRRVNYHKRRVNIKPSQKKFLNGWINRANSFKP